MATNAQHERVASTILVINKYEERDMNSHPQAMIENRCTVSAVFTESKGFKFTARRETRKQAVSYETQARLSIKPDFLELMVQRRVGKKSFDFFLCRHKNRSPHRLHHNGVALQNFLHFLHRRTSLFNIHQ